MTLSRATPTATLLAVLVAGAAVAEHAGPCVPRIPERTGAPAVVLRGGLLRGAPPLVRVRSRARRVSSTGAQCSEASASEAAYEGANVPTTLINLVKGVVGSGVLSLPAAIAAFSSQRAATAPSVAILVAAAAISGARGSGAHAVLRPAGWLVRPSSSPSPFSRAVTRPRLSRACAHPPPSLPPSRARRLLLCPRRAHMRRDGQLDVGGRVDGLDV